MQVRHNTALLEQAIALILRRASIPVQQAEAEALAKRARAVAHRRLATGIAVALAAIGIGLGLMFGLWKPPVFQSAAVAPSNEVPKSSRQAPAEQPDVRPPAAPQPVASDPVIDFEKFATVSAHLLGKNWDITAGHHYSNETDQVWQNAWCYTNPSINGVKLSIELANRASPTARPTALIASPETLAKAGLDDRAALDLATKCPWLDKASFRLDDFTIPPDRQAIRPDAAPSFTMEGRVLTFHGPILNNFLDELKSRDFDRLVVSSPGGLVVSALEAGDWLRLGSKAVDVEGECLSACVLVLAGGSARTATADSRIGVHRFYSRAEDDHRNDMEFGQEMSSTIIKYLNRMSVDEALFHAMASVPSENIVYLDHEVLRKWNLLGAVPTTPPPEDVFVAPQENYDAIGGDLPNMQFKNSDQQDCEARCRAEPRCVAYTLNRRNGTCFLKGTATELFQTPGAVTGFRSNAVAPRVSAMRTLPGVALLGDWHIRGRIGYADCVFGCESDNSCAGFTHDSKALQCVYFNMITKQKNDSMCAATCVSGIK
jgi:hypothetical protein